MPKMVHAFIRGDGGIVATHDVYQDVSADEYPGTTRQEVPADQIKPFDPNGVALRTLDGRMVGEFEPQSMARPRGLVEEEPMARPPVAARQFGTRPRGPQR